MVAYGVPVIHQSLATAPLDIKEAIDWLIRIGGKDVKEKGKDRSGELLKVAECCFQQEGNATSAVKAINEAVTPLMSLTEQLAKFIGYEFNGDGSYGHRQLNGSGIGRRGGHSILSDVSKGGFLLCCKDESACTSLCKCCQGDNSTGAICSPHSCPIKTVLECSITLIGMCGEKGDRRPNSSKDTAYFCCILSFLITCFSEDAESDTVSLKCKHCDGPDLHNECHGGCVCIHKKAISKVACRINCLIQSATTITTLYNKKNVPICLTCRNCIVCNPAATPPKCNPCSKCEDALTGNGEHCEYCRTGQCCIENKDKNETCQKRCNGCHNCSLVRNAKAFWDMLDHVLYSCGKCTRCRSTSSPQERIGCPTCSTCPGDSCDDGCIYRKCFGRLICEFIHFIVYNFGEVAYTLRGNITCLKDECCKQRSKSTDCQCTKKCCGPSTGASVCDDCKAYCICCIDQGNMCKCSNDCAGKLELLLRPALSGYVSAYDYNSASWEALCKKEQGKNRCSDQCTESCNCGSAICPTNGCCAHCPKRQCAKLFCLVVPAIYDTLEYLRRHVTVELSNPNSTTTSQWADAIISGDAYLGELFRSCGFSSDRLQPRMGCELMQNSHKTASSSCRSSEHKPGNLKDILDSCGKVNNYIGEALGLCNRHSGREWPYKKPTTVREKQLWLCGLPYSDVYEDLKKAFVASMPNDSSSLHIMELTLRLCVFPFHILEDSSQRVWEYITEGFNVPNTKESLYYNPNPTRLLWDLYDAMYDVTCALTFLNKQCNVSSINSGWEDCKFGKNVNLNGSINDICNCQTRTCKGSCDHCTTVCNACRGDAKCVCCCPHCEQRGGRCTCLMRFVISGGPLSGNSTVSLFHNERYGYMAFRKSDLRTVEMSGVALYDCMSGLFTDDHTIFSRFLESLLIARAGAPNNLSDFYALFLGLGMRLQMESNHSGVAPNALAVLFKSKMRNTFFGAHDRIMEPVITTARTLYKEDSGHTFSSGARTVDSIHIASDLMSLYGCYSGVGCVGYMYALPSGPYELFSRYPHAAVGESASLFTKWILSGATSLYNNMLRFTEEVSMLECCTQRNICTCNPTDNNACECTDCNCFCVGTAGNCSCGTIIKCKYVHPLLYRNGLTFQEPDMWSSPKRRCRAFVDTLNRFIGRDSMLCQLIEAIENFLWHIRMPFCIAFLILWSTAFCFLMYVLIGYLDRLGMRSRWVSRTPIAHPIQLFTTSMVKTMGGGGAVI